jgi:methylated-DNA-protein-cysteine methyltransferase related protein
VSVPSSRADSASHAASSESLADTSAARVARILARVRAIPEGFVRTYGDVDPNAPRLVGHVLATTPEDVPWHRVVRADGSVAVGRLQLELLRKEGVPIRSGRVVLRLARLPDTDR